MNKNILIGSFIAVLTVCAIVLCINFFDKKNSENSKIVMPEIGQKIWTYDMVERKWHNYNKNDEDNLKEYIVLQFDDPISNGGYSAYHLQTTNAQVPKEQVWIGEASQEFLINGKLYSYYPKNFEFYEIRFNGVKFIPKQLNAEEVKEIFKGYELVKVSKMKNGKFSSSGKSKFIIMNDIGESFYKYYIVPNDSKKLQIGDFSNQFEIKDDVDVKIQRLEGCSKTYPCYDLNLKVN